jgi:RNA polymerase sigma-70 factor (ECF subfamily)
MNWEVLPVDELFRACARANDADAWAEFIRRFHPVIKSSAIRVSQRWKAVEEVDDVVQEIYFKLCSDGARILKEARTTDPTTVAALIKVIATNTARDFFRSKNALKRGTGLVPLLEDESDAFALPADIERHVTLAQLNELVRANTQGGSALRDRAIFQLYYRDGMSARAIAELPGIELNAKGVEGVLHRLTGALRKAVAGAQEFPHGLRSTEEEDVGT